MQRVEAMARRLPQLYRDGELLRGSRRDGGLLEVPAVQLESLAEEAREVQRTHWFEMTYELAHAARLAALLDLTPEPWQDLDTFRTWVHALRDAMLEKGGVTVEAIEWFVTEYVTGMHAATGVDALSESAKVIENPRRRQYARIPELGALSPLQQFTLTNSGFGTVPLSLLLTATGSDRESTPLIVNLTTREALLFEDEIPNGKRLWIRARGDEVRASLEGEDVTAKLRSITELEPGTPWKASQVGAAKPLTLIADVNEFWFFPVALYDVAGLDRALMTMPDLSVSEGTFDASGFDRAIFWQPPALVLWASWEEEAPAAFEVHMPAARMLTKKRAAEAVPERDVLGASTAKGVQLLRAAGVRSEVVMHAFAETQGQLDALRLVMPIELREMGSSGADALVSHGAVFGSTSFDDSTFR
jgi:hypothetical protein